MDFRELFLFVEHIKKSIPCQECGYHYNDQDFRLIGTVFDQGYIQANCTKCKRTVIINVVFGAKNARTHRSLNSQNLNHKIISQDDILDMQNFLKKFDGDFIKLFNNKS